MDFSRYFEIEDKLVFILLIVKGSEKMLMICKYWLLKEINNYIVK